MSNLGNFVWSIADQLRGVYKPHQYGNVILPMTILRRLDCILEPNRDEVRALAAKYDNPGALAVQVKRKTGLGFYNSSEFDFASLLTDPDGLRANLVDYLTKFSPNIDVFERFKFDNEIATLEEKNRLYLVVSKFAEVDLHPDVMPNAEMGDLFEELIRKFAEASNEEAGEHYTPRDAIRLMVDLLFAEDSVALLEPGTVRSIYDPTAGTGGMLSVAEERLLERNPEARLALYGQEINDQSYAICKSDMIAKGQDASNIRLGDTLAEDLFAGRTFDFCMSNPPYGVDWKAAEKLVKEERKRDGAYGRFGPGLPPVSDGQMLFLLHLASKMRPEHEGGGRAGIVLNGSPLFNGGAGSGPSEIRRWLLEGDLVDAIVALPTNMFFNTGIGTYVWILDNTKRPERKGKVQLIDATSFWTKIRKNLGSKNREIDADAREKILALYDAFADREHSKVFSSNAFGYWTITVERPLLDDNGEPVTDRKGNPKPDAKMRDTENVPFTYGGNERGAEGAAETVKTYFETEVLPHVADAWVDDSKTKVGYEIPFTRHFYSYVPPRPLVEIDADLSVQRSLIDTLRERRDAVVESGLFSAAPCTTGQRIKHLITEVRQGWSPQCYPWAADGVDTWGVLKAGAANGGIFRAYENKELPATEEPRPDLTIRRGDLVMSRANTRELLGSAAVVLGDYPRLMLCDKLYAFTLDKERADPRYVAMVLGTRHWRGLIELEASGSSQSMQNISLSDILNLPMDLPPVSTQRTIVAYLDEENAKIDTLVLETERFIELAKERRAALITAAVTQIDPEV